MSANIEAIFSATTILFSLVIWALTLTLRRIVDGLLKLKKWEEASVWRDIILPTLPIAIGVLLALLLTDLPHPEGWESRGARVLYGLVCGFFSGNVYRIVQGMGAKWSGSLSSSDVSSPPPSSG